jgi:hypothetical protein
MQPEVLVFKTDISYLRDAEKVCNKLKKHPNVKACNVAIDDRDRVLRVESAGIETIEIIELLKQFNFYCEELMD